MGTATATATATSSLKVLQKARSGEGFGEEKA
jgi:hypothetical protein